MRYVHVHALTRTRALCVCVRMRRTCADFAYTCTYGCVHVMCTQPYKDSDGEKRRGRILLQYTWMQFLSYTSPCGYTRSKDRGSATYTCAYVYNDRGKRLLVFEKSWISVIRSLHQRASVRIPRVLSYANMTHNRACLLV
jgi:hypothetical protein